MPDMSGRLLLMSGRGLRPCRTFCPAGFNPHKMSDKANKNDHWYLPVINWEKCLTGTQHVRQIVEGLPDILSGTPEIIFAITDTTTIKLKPHNNQGVILSLSILTRTSCRTEWFIFFILPPGWGFNGPFWLCYSYSEIKYSLSFVNFMFGCPGIIFSIKIKSIIEVKLDFNWHCSAGKMSSCMGSVQHVSGGHTSQAHKCVLCEIYCTTFSTEVCRVSSKL